MRTLAILSLFVGNIHGTSRHCSPVEVARIAQHCISKGQEEVDSLIDYAFDASMGQEHERSLNMRESNAMEQLFNQAERQIVNLCGDRSMTTMNAQQSLYSHREKLLKNIAPFFEFRIREAARYDTWENLHYLTARDVISHDQARSMASSIYKLMHKAIQTGELEYWDAYFSTPVAYEQINRLKEAVMHY